MKIEKISQSNTINADVVKSEENMTMCDSSEGEATMNQTRTINISIKIDISITFNFIGRKLASIKFGMNRGTGGEGDPEEKRD